MELLKAIVLKMITQMQKILLKSQKKIAVDSYYSLAKLHFKIHFGKELEEEVLNNSDIAYMATKRHGRLVLKVLYKDSSRMTRKMVRYASRSVFSKNIILSARL